MSTRSDHENRLVGRHHDADRRYDRVARAIATASTTTNGLSVSAIAQAAGVHRSYLYRHSHLLELVRERSRTPPDHPVAAEQTSRASLQADLAHARTRAARAEAQARQLTQRLSEALGRQTWADTGLEPPDQTAHLERKLEQARQQLAELTASLDDRTQELEAARAANRELIATLNTRR